jgi:AcrR family transcriptional regulator
MTTARPARSPRRRVPRNTLNPDRILDAAVTLLDRDGAEAFTMRALAEELGVGTMAVYSHFRGKDELSDAVAQRLLAEVELPATGVGDPGDRITEVVRSLYRLFSEHPSALQLLTSRPMRGDEQIAVTDQLLGLLRSAGLGRTEAVRAYVALMQYTVGAAVWTTRSRRRCEREEGVGERIKKRLTALPPDSYPSLTDLAPELSAVGNMGPVQFEYGLGRLVRGLLGR